MNEINKTRLKYAAIPLFILLFLILIPLPFYFFYHFEYFSYMPVILFIAGITVIFGGAWSSFGAKSYIKDVFRTGLPFNEGDLNYIYKQQLIMTLIYIGIGLIYIIFAFLISFL
ncbi:hypothetical protein [Picrophilus oshimae]|uniref:Uncharacterized protein n=1 Tax=Picrophilus torridus (strain ATCC 700027 / DSM 9790 / JCM 10055 / NBRC 100828 / KAW 2/3) TaxID=1122961 RepID=A0A8G2FVW5_PICTO|nr:hypothetical protein [Picrophilus oshimae]SMD30424.1 hypothetical protein SAMN02745355_0304 [Picrophilus oshimae DSM 9789]